MYGSGRRVESELAHPLVWNRIRTIIRDRFPDQPSMWLSEQPMRRYHYLYGRTVYLTNPTILDQLGTIHRTHAAQQARQLGLLDPDGAGSWTHPDLGRAIYADGKVITPSSKPTPEIGSSTDAPVSSPTHDPNPTPHSTSKAPAKPHGDASS